MNTPTTGLRVAATVFGLMALAQLGRLVIQPVIVVAGITLPLWPSAVACILLAALSAWLWRLARSGAR